MALSILVLTPISPRAGIENLKSVYSPRGVSSSRMPRRLPTISMMGPIFSVGTSMFKTSYGSCSSPSMFLRTTRGLPTLISNPSRRMVSIKIERWSTPRPQTANDSLPSTGRTRSATLRSSSFSKRVLSWRVVTYFPSLPAKGDVLMLKIISKVGSSTRKRGSAFTSPRLQMVSPMSIFSMPTTATMSPAVAFSMSMRPSLSNICRLAI